MNIDPSNRQTTYVGSAPSPTNTTVETKKIYDDNLKIIEEILSKSPPYSAGDAEKIQDALNKLNQLKKDNALTSDMKYELEMMLTFFSFTFQPIPGTDGHAYQISIDDLATIKNMTVTNPVTGAERDVLEAIATALDPAAHADDAKTTFDMLQEFFSKISGDNDVKMEELQKALDTVTDITELLTIFTNLLNLATAGSPENMANPTSWSDIPEVLQKQLYEMSGGKDWDKIRLEVGFEIWWSENSAALGIPAKDRDACKQSWMQGDSGSWNAKYNDYLFENWWNQNKDLLGYGENSERPRMFSHDELKKYWTEGQDFQLNGGRGTFGKVDGRPGTWIHQNEDKVKADFYDFIPFSKVKEYLTTGKGAEAYEKLMETYYGGTFPPVIPALTDQNILDFLNARQKIYDIIQQLKGDPKTPTGEGSPVNALQAILDNMDKVITKDMFTNKELLNQNIQSGGEWKIDNATGKFIYYDASGEATKLNMSRTDTRRFLQDWIQQNFDDRTLFTTAKKTTENFGSTTKDELNIALQSFQQISAMLTKMMDDLHKAAKLFASNTR